MTNLHERMLPDVRIETATVCIPGGGASDRATDTNKGDVDVWNFESVAQANVANVEIPPGGARIGAKIPHWMSNNLAEREK